MPVVFLKATIEKPYEHWVKVFDAHRETQESAGFNALYRGHEVDDPTSIRIIMRAPSVEGLQQFMQEQAENIASSGHVLGSEEIIVCTDM